MADDSKAKTPGRRKKGPAATIDLTATEIVETPGMASDGPSKRQDAADQSPSEPAAEVPPVTAQPETSAAAMAEDTAREEMQTNTPDRPAAEVRDEPSIGAPLFTEEDARPRSMFERPLVTAIAGGVVGAVFVGVLAAGGVIGGRSVDPALLQRIAGLEQDLASTKAIADGAASSVAAATVTAETARDSAAAANSTASEARAEAQEALNVASAPRDAGGAAVDLAPLEARIAAIEARPAADGPIDLSGIEQRLASLEARPAGTAAPDRSAAIAISLTTLAAAIESGRPFVTELRTASAIIRDDDKLAALADYADKGAPTAAALARAFDSVAPKLLEELTKETTGGSQDEDLFARLLDSASRVVIIRKVGDETTDAAAPIAQTREALVRGDVAAAIAAFDALPEAVRRAAADWRQEAKAAVDVADAVARMRTDALAALGG